MSLRAMLEVANTQNSVGVLADALAMHLDTSRLNSSTEIISEKSLKLYIENASAEEAVGLVNVTLDQADLPVNVEVFESACGSCAVIVFNDDEEATEVAHLEQAGVILEMAAKPIEDDDEDEPHLAEEDDDVDPDGEEDEDAEAEDPNVMKVLHSEEAFKLATRLQQMACGPNKAEFPYFMTKLDSLMQEFRNRSGYDPNQQQEIASGEEDGVGFLLSSVLDEAIEEARGKKKKKGFREGRGGFLSAYMRFVGKRGEDLGEAWDALDIPALTSILSDCGAQLMEMVEEERIKRGLDEQPEEENPAPSEETATVVDK